MQYIGQQQFLMLLLMMQSDLDNRCDAINRGVIGAFDQCSDEPVDMRAISGDLLRIRARDETARGARVAGTGGDIIRVEQEGEAVVERFVTGRKR